MSDYPFLSGQDFEFQAGAGCGEDLTGFLGEWVCSGSSCIMGGSVWEVRCVGLKVGRCVLCGSDGVFLWLGGSIDLLYHWAECQYMRPIVIEGTEEKNSVARPLPCGSREGLSGPGEQAGTGRPVPDLGKSH